MRCQGASLWGTHGSGLLWGTEPTGEDPAAAAGPCPGPTVPSGVGKPERLLQVCAAGPAHVASGCSLPAALGFASFPGVQKEGGRAKGALDLCSNVAQVVEGTQVGVGQAWAVPAVRGLGRRLLSLGVGFRTCTGGPWTPAPGAAVGMTGGW